MAEGNGNNPTNNQNNDPQNNNQNNNGGGQSNNEPSPFAAIVGDEPNNNQPNPSANNQPNNNNNNNQNSPTNNNQPDNKNNQPNNNQSATPDFTEQNRKMEEATKRVERTADVTNFLSSDDGKLFVKYAEQIRKVATNPNYFNIPVSQLPSVVLTPAAYSKVLEDARNAANQNARNSANGGGSGVNSGGGNNPSATDGMYDQQKEIVGMDMRNMPKDEFAKLTARAKAGEFHIKTQ